jgi:hypothetical protein
MPRNIGCLGEDTCTIQALIIPGRRVFQWLQMREDSAFRQRMPDRKFDFFAEVVTMAHSPSAGHENM